MQRGQSLCLDKETSLGKEERAITSSEGLSFTLKQSPQTLLEGSPPNTKGTKRCSAKKNRRDCPDTLSGTMQSNCSRGLPHCYRGDSSPLLRAKLWRHR